MPPIPIADEFYRASNDGEIDADLIQAFSHNYELTLAAHAGTGYGSGNATQATSNASAVVTGITLPTSAPAGGGYITFRVQYSGGGDISHTVPVATFYALTEVPTVGNPLDDTDSVEFSNADGSYRIGRRGATLVFAAGNIDTYTVTATLDSFVGYDSASTTGAIRNSSGAVTRDGQAYTLTSFRQHQTYIIAAMTPATNAETVFSGDHLDWNGNTLQFSDATYASGTWTWSSQTEGVLAAGDVDVSMQAPLTDSAGRVLAPRLPYASMTQDGIITSNERDRIHTSVDGAHLEDAPEHTADTLQDSDEFLIHDASVTQGSQLAEIRVDQVKELIRDTIGTALTAGTNVTITEQDAANTITIAASGTGGANDDRLDPTTTLPAPDTESAGSVRSFMPTGSEWGIYVNEPLPTAAASNTARGVASESAVTGVFVFTEVEAHGDRTQFQWRQAGAGGGQPASRVLIGRRHAGTSPPATLYAQVTAAGGPFNITYARNTGADTTTEYAYDDSATTITAGAGPVSIALYTDSGRTTAYAIKDERHWVRSASASVMATIPVSGFGPVAGYSTANVGTLTAQTIGLSTPTAPANGYSVTDNRITVPSAGTYRIEAVFQITNDGPTGGSRLYPRIHAQVVDSGGTATDVDWSYQQEYSGKSPTSGGGQGPSPVTFHYATTVEITDPTDTIRLIADGNAREIPNWGILATDSELRISSVVVATSATYTGLSQGDVDARVAAAGFATTAQLADADMAERVRDWIGTALTAGTNVTVTPDDAANTITIASTASGGLDQAAVDARIAAEVDDWALVENDRTLIPISKLPDKLQEIDEAVTGDGWDQDQTNGQVSSATAASQGSTIPTTLTYDKSTYEQSPRVTNYFVQVRVLVAQKTELANWRISLEETDQPRQNFVGTAWTHIGDQAGWAYYEQQIADLPVGVHVNIETFDPLSLDTSKIELLGATSPAQYYGTGFRVSDLGWHSLPAGGAMGSGGGLSISFMASLWRWSTTVPTPGVIPGATYGTTGWTGLPTNFNDRAENAPRVAGGGDTLYRYDFWITVTNGVYSVGRASIVAETALNTQYSNDIATDINAPGATTTWSSTPTASSRSFRVRDPYTGLWSQARSLAPDSGWKSLGRFDGFFGAMTPAHSLTLTPEVDLDSITWLVLEYEKYDSSGQTQWKSFVAIFAKFISTVGYGSGTNTVPHSISVGFRRDGQIGVSAYNLSNNIADDASEAAGFRFRFQRPNGVNDVNKVGAIVMEHPWSRSQRGYVNVWAY